MIQIQKSKLEELLGHKIQDGIKSLGVDTASRTGWALLHSNADLVTINFGYIDVDSSSHHFKFERMIEIFQDLLKRENPDIVVVEDTFLKFHNARTLKLLTRLGMIVWIMAKLQNQIGIRRFILPKESRANLGLNGGSKKEEVHKEFKEKFGIQIDDIDIVDAIILSLNGVIPWQEKQKSKPKRRTKQQKLLAKRPRKLKKS